MSNSVKDLGIQNLIKDPIIPNLVKDLKASVIEEFGSHIRGKIILPKDSNYDETRKVFNAMINKHPGMIVKCVDVADVMNAVNFGRENNLSVAVRGGGHNGGGLGMCDDGLVIDLSGIKFVLVDTAEKKFGLEEEMYGEKLIMRPMRSVLLFRQE